MWNSMSTRKLGRTQTWLFEQATKVPWSTDFPPTQSRLAMNEKSSRHSSRQIDLAHILGSTNEGEWREVAMCTEGVRDDIERWRICANSISIVSAWTFAVRSMVWPSSGNWRPCVRFHASRLILWNNRSSSERTRTWWMNLETTWHDERHANGKPWLYRIPGWKIQRAHGFQTWQNGAMSVCAWVERNTCGFPCGRPSHLCQASNAWKILDADHEVGRDQERRSSQSPRSCGLPGIRVPKCTRRWTRIHSETYHQERGRMLGHGSTTERKGSDDVFWRNWRAWIGTMRRRCVLKSNIYCSELLLDNCSTQPEWDRIWCSWQNACHTNLHHQHLQIWHVPRKRWDIWKEHVNWISTWQYLHRNRMTGTRPWNTSRDTLMLTGLVTQWRGKAHLALCVTLINFSWRANVEDRELLPCPAENQNCMRWVHCQLSWFSHKLSWKRLDDHSWNTREQTAAQHAQWQRNKERVAIWNTFAGDSCSFQIWYFGNCWRCHRSRLTGTRGTSGRKRWDVNDSTDWDRCLYGDKAERDEFSWQLARRKRVTRRVASRTYGESDESNDRHMWATVDVVEFFQYNEGRLIWHSLATRGGVLVEPV